MNEMARPRLLNEAKRSRLRQEVAASTGNDDSWSFEKLRGLDVPCIICGELPRENLGPGGPSQLRGWQWVRGRWIHEPCQR